jgi:hypothetical protein
MSIDSSRVPTVEDPRLRFYLDHYREIETWALLRREACARICEGLLALGDVLEEDAAQRLDARKVDVSVDANRVQVRRPSWIAGVAVAFEWRPEPIRAGGTVWLFMGLRGEREEISPENLAYLDDLGSAARSGLGSGWDERPTASWVAWRWVRPQGARFDETAIYETVVQEFWRCWALTAPRIDGLS